MSGWLVLNLVRTQDGYGNEGDRAETGDQLSDQDESDEDEITHAVPFKCIGDAHEKNYQHHLEQACLALHGQDKPVCIYKKTISSCHVPTSYPGLFASAVGGQRKRPWLRLVCFAT